MTINKPNRNLRYPALVTVFAYCWQLLFLMTSGVASAADLVSANVAAGQRPIIDAATNGTPIVHIAPPNSTGLSHNQYETLNVPQKGLILNNSSAPVQTQLGGWVSGNLQLGTVPARIILNEVVSSNPSQFMGTLEVAGQKADIVVANPNGITCDGCGFINSDRATLTTGTPNINSAGRLQGFEVKQGAISVTGDGLNATQLEQLDLLARGIVIEGELWAKDLQILTGSNQVLYADLSATEIKGQGTAPRFAIDIKQVGGMYANTIHLIATEDGLGVNSTGRMAALTGDLVLAASGDLSLKEIHAQNILSLSNTGDIILGDNTTATTLQINSSGELTNNATAEASALTFAATNISNTGVIHQTAAQSTTRLQADGAVSNTGQIYSQAAVTLSGDTVNDLQGSIASEQALVINAREITLNGTRLASNQTMTLNGNRLSADSATVSTNADLTLTVRDALTTTQGTWQAAGTIRLDAAQVTNQGSDIAAGEQLRISSDETVNRGNFSAQGPLDITTKRLTSENGGIASLDRLTLTAEHISNTGGLIQSAGDMRITTIDIINQQSSDDRGIVSTANLTLSAESLDNATGRIASRGPQSLTLSGALNNYRGLLQSESGLTIQAGSVNGTEGNMIAEGDLTLNATDGPLDLANSNLSVTGSANLNAAGVAITENADLVAGKDITLTSASLNNKAGTLAAGIDSTDNTTATLMITTGALDNSEGRLINQAGAINIDIQGQSLANRNGLVESSGELSINAGALDNTLGRLSGDGLSLTSDSLVNTEGVTSSQGLLTLVTQAFSNVKGLFQSADDIQITATDITNLQSGDDRGIVTTGKLTVNAEDLDNSEGRVISQGSQHLTLSGSYNNQQGRLQSGSELIVEAARFEGTDVQVIAEGDLRITTSGDTVLNQASLYSGKALTLSAANISGDDAELLSQGNLAATAKTQTLTNSKLNTQGDLTLNATDGALDLTNSDLSVMDSASLSASGAAISENADLVAGKNLQLISTSLNNKAGTLAAGIEGADSANNTAVTLTITTGILDNSDGQLVNLAGDLAIDTQGQALNNQRGTIQSSNDLELTNSGALTNTDGTLLATGAISATVDALDNTRGLVQASEDTTLDSQGRVTNADTRISGGIVTQGKLTLDASELDNQQGYIASGNDQQLTLSSTLNNTSGEILSTQALTLSAARIENGAGSIKAHGLTDVTTDTFNNQQGGLNTEGQLTLQTKALDNTGGTLSANGDFTLTSEANQLAGAISSQQDLTINITGDLNNSAALSAQQAMVLSADGITHSSSGTLFSGDSITVNGDSLVNQSEITSARVELNLTGEFTNESTGLIDATNTTISAAQLDNNGRIYGDEISLSSRLINNLKDAVIAARNYLGISTDTLENSDGAMLYSVGNLDIEGQTSGTRASRVANGSSLIEADGNIRIAADVLENTNSKLVLGSESEPTAYRTYDQYGIPGWNPSEDYRETQEYTDIKRDTVTASQPGQILAGGNINLEGSSVLNHDSTIVAGQALSSTAALTNTETPGVENMTRHGQHRMVWLSSGGWQNGGWQAFNEVTTTAIPLNITQSLQGMAAQAYLDANGNASPAGSQAAIKSDVELATHRVQSTNLKDPTEGSAVQGDIQRLTSTSGTPVTLATQPALHATSATAPQAMAPTPVTSTALTVEYPAPLSPPSNKLFVLNTSPQASYLVETDPRFTSKKAFLSSDYMLEQLAKDPSRQLKRYGDGFYEQTLLTDQITAMTGHRYLPDYRSSEVQYTALMDAGVSFANTYQLTPGVALSAAQMTLLTSDIVWLVETSVVLPDGSTTTVLAPQVYLRNLEQGDLHTSGALVSARDIDIKSTAGITNEGTLLAADSLALRTGKGITNLGTIKGLKSLTLNAQDDILNQAGRYQGGQISGGDVSLTSRAGNIASLTNFSQQTTSNTLFSQVGQTRAAISTTGNLRLNAAKDIEFLAADARTAGNLDLIAGNDIQLEALQARNRSAYVWGNGHVITDTAQHHASTLKAGQDLQLSAAHDLNLRATEVTATGNLALNAGNDINLLAANDEDYYSSRHTEKKSLGRSKSGVTEQYHSENRGVALKAGQDLRINTDGVDENNALVTRASGDVNIQGADIEAGGNALITARGDINLTPGSKADYAYSQSSKSGFGGFSKKQSVSMAKQTEAASTQITTQGDNLIQAGGDLTALAADIRSQGVTHLSALGEENIDNGSVNLLAGQNSRETFSETKKSKIGLSFSNNILSIASERASQNTQLDISNVATRIDGQEGIQVEARKAINIVGSELQSEGDIQLRTVEGDINIAAGVERHANEQRQSTSRKGIGLSSDSNGISQFVGEETVADRDEWEGVTLASSQLRSGGNTKLQAGNDVSIVASDIVAAENVELSAANDIRVRTEQEVYRTLQENSVSRDGLTVTLQHNYGKTRDALSGAGEGEDGTSKASSTLAAIDAVDSFLAGPTGSAHLGTTTDTTTTIDSNALARGSQIVAGNDVLMDAENDVELQATRIIALNDTRINAKNIELTAVQNTNANAQQVTHESDGISLEGSKSSARAGVTFANGKTEYNANQGVASVTRIESGNNASLIAEQDLRLEGTQISAGNVQLNAGNELEIIAAETASDSRFNDKQTSGGAGIGATINSNGAAFGVNVHLAYAKNKLDRDGAQQQNAQINATDTLEFSSGEDTRIQGANLEAQHIKGSVGGDLTVSSVQDTGKADGERKDASIDVTVGYGYSVSGGIGYGETEGEKQWVEKQTSLIGRQSVELDTENHTQIDAALIAQIDEQGNDGGNLTLNTGSLGHTDLKDYDQESTEYLHVNGSLSQNGNGSEGGSDDKADGSSGWGVQGQDYEKDRQQITRATLGEGTINVASDASNSLDSINRDIDNAQELLKDEESNTELYITSNSIAAVEGMFTEDDPNTEQNENTFGRWAEELNDYGRNTTQVFVNIGKTAEQIEGIDNVPAQVLGAVTQGMINTLDVLGTVTMGLVPGVEKHGGLVTHLPALVFGDQLNNVMTVELIRTVDQQGKETFTVGDLKVLKENIDLEKLPKDIQYVFVNGIMNTLKEAARNGAMQTGADRLLVAYNPTHGFLADLIESGWDATIGAALPSGNSRQIADMWSQFAKMKTPMNGAAHSQGGLLTLRALQWMDEGILKKNKKGTFQFQINGAPVSTAEFATAVEERTKATFKGHNINSGDPVPLVLGGNAANATEMLGAMLNIVNLFDSTVSPHSSYVCKGDFCDNNQPEIGAMP